MMMMKFIVAIFLSLVTVNAQQSDAEVYTKDRIEQIRNISDSDTKNAVIKLITKILQNPDALNLINTTDFWKAQHFLSNTTNSINIKGVSFQNFGDEIHSILSKMSPAELEKLNQQSNVPNRTWYQNVIYILWGIKKGNQLELAKNLLGITPPPPRDSILTIPREGAHSRSGSMLDAYPTTVYNPTPLPRTVRAAPSTEVTGSSPGWYPFPTPVPRTGMTASPDSAGGLPAQQSPRPTDYTAPSSLAASSPMHMPVRSVGGGQESISSNDLLMRIERNVMARQARWKKTFIEDDKVNFTDFKSFLTPYQSLDNLIKYIKNNRITQDYNHLRNNKNPDQRVVDRVMKNYQNIAAFMGEKMDSPDDWARIYQLFLSNKVNILNDISFHRDRMRERLTQWLLNNKDSLKTKIDQIYQEIQNEIFMDYVDVKPLSDQYSHSTESNALANIGTLRIADIFGISGYPYQLYFNNLNDFASRVDKFSSLMPEKGLGEKQKVMIVNEIIKTMRHMKTYHNTLTPQTKTFTYKADAVGVIWNSHLLVLSLRLAMERELFDLLEDPSVNSDGKITMTIAQTLGHFYELLEKPKDDLLEIKLIESRRTILEQYKNEIRTYAGAPTQLSSAASSYAATAGSSVKRGRDGDGNDDPSKRFRPADTTTTLDPAHSPRAPR
jgi:hypothetical protein